MFIDTTFPPPVGRLAQIMRLVDDCERETIEQAVERLIASLDARDGDPDLEQAGDELDASWVEGGGVRDPMRGGVGPEDAEDDDPREMTAINGSQWWDRAAKGTDDDEDEPDRCDAGDDLIAAGPVVDRGYWLDRNLARCWNDLRPGNEEDAEADRPAAYRLDQSAPLFLHAENDA